MKVGSFIPRAVQSVCSRYCCLWAFSFGFSLEIFKMSLVGRDFYTLVKNVLFPSPTDMGSHNPPPSGLSVFAGTRSLFQSMWDLTIHPPSKPNVVTDTRSSLQSMWDLTIQIFYS